MLSKQENITANVRGGIYARSALEDEWKELTAKEKFERFGI